MTTSFFWRHVPIVMGAVVTLAIISGCATRGDNTARPRLSAFGTPRPPTTPRTKPVKITDDEALDIQLALGRTLEQKGELDYAGDLYRKILVDSPQNALAIHRLAIIADRQERFEESAELFEQALRIRPQDADVLCDYGFSLYRQQRWAEAETRFQQALAANPRHQRTHNNYGLLLARADRQEEALVAFRQAGCTSIESQMNLALALTLNGRPNDAKQKLDEVRNAKFLSVAVRNRINQLQELIDTSVAEAQAETPLPRAMVETPAPSMPAYPSNSGSHGTVAHWQ